MGLVRTLSRHILAELYGCDRGLLDDLSSVREFLLNATRAIGATVVGDTFHRFSPQGVTGVVAIAESHLSIHTWPEHSYATVDVHTCADLDPHPGLKSLAADLRAGSLRIQEIARGLPGDLEAGRALLPADVHLITDLTQERLADAADLRSGLART